MTAIDEFAVVDMVAGAASASCSFACHLEASMFVVVSGDGQEDRGAQDVLIKERETKSGRKSSN